MNKSLLLVCGGVLLGIITGAATAADSGSYAGISVGQSKTQMSSGDIDSTWANLGFGATATSLDSTDTGWKFYSGYRFNKSFAIEGGYVDLGRFGLSTSRPSGVMTGKANPAKGGLFVDAVGIVPLRNDFSVFGKLGGYWVVSELQAAGSGSADNFDKNYGIHYGLGGAYSFTKTLSVRLEWERFDKVGNRNSTGQGNADLLSVGLVYNE